MNVHDFAVLLRAGGVPVVVHHLADRHGDVSFTSVVDLDDVTAELGLINDAPGGVLVRSSGWVWVLAATGPVYRGVEDGCRRDGPGQDAAINAINAILHPTEPAAKPARKKT